MDNMLIMDRIGKLDEQTLQCIQTGEFYDAFVCMLERGKQLMQLTNTEDHDTIALAAMLKSTQHIEQLLLQEIARYQAALTTITKNSQAHLAYARSAEAR